MTRTKKVNQTLDNFLFKQIEDNPDYQHWALEYEIPDYIIENLHPSKKLRGYQENALKHFIFLYEHDREKAKHLLFNMATGTGKTLVMAAVVLFLFKQGYRNFLFLVHQIQIKEQAVRNFTDSSFSKYLFNPKGVKIDGRKISVREVNSVEDSERNSINFLFYSTALLYNRLRENHENGLTGESFERNDIVIIADEAHRLNVDTRSKSKKDKDEAHNWETTVLSAITSREENMLLEFTATVDLANQAIHDKYENKMLYRYDFLAFNKEGYSKDVKFLYNREVHTENQKRLLIINAVALSEFRRLYADHVMNKHMTPIVLVKSTGIAKSEEDRKFFDEVISSIRLEDLERLKSITEYDTGHTIIKNMFDWLERQGKDNPYTPAGGVESLKAFIADIRVNFAHSNTLIYNSKTKERADLLVNLDSPRNTIRAIFSVNALNEGWDVLGLYDIIHFDISETKKVSLQDIQLIGRGARYNPFDLPKRYGAKDANFPSINGLSFEFDKYKRKFDNSPDDRGRVLETFVYHFVKTGTFLETLQRDLLGEGIINEGVEKKTITLKQEFLESETYCKGFILVNHIIRRSRTTDDEIDTTFKRVIKAGTYKIHTSGLTDREENQIIASYKTADIRISKDFFPEAMIRKALVAAEGNFFRHNNLCEHIKGLETVDTFIKDYLPEYDIKYTYEKGKSIQELTNEEKLQLLVNVILPEVRKSIDLNLPKEMGSKKFRPIPLPEIFKQEKSIYLMAFPEEDEFGNKIYKSGDQRAQSQTHNLNPDLQYDVASSDWYAYSENYGTSEEKRFVKYIATQIDDLHAKYKSAEIYLIRNELDYWLYSPKDGRRFSPDYLLIINDVQNHEVYYQAIIEPKGGHILEGDIWKEEVLISLNKDSQVVFDENENDTVSYKDYLKEAQQFGYKVIKPIGLKFYNSDTRGEEDFALDFQNILLENTN
ncbi:MAG: DEAD/DEAH box helicase family protein [Micrococcaceae bacterium]